MAAVEAAAGNVSETTEAATEAVAAATVAAEGKRPAESQVEEGPPKKRPKKGKQEKPDKPVRPDGPRTLAVLGLGNPGGSKRNERHSLGARVIEALIAAKNGSDIEAIDSNCKDVEGSYWMQCGQDKALLLLPQRAINDSGEQLKSALDALGVAGVPFLAVVDDCWLPLGSLRYRAEGSSGGHKGLENIKAHLANDERYHRLRLGIGGSNKKDFVTGSFTDEDEQKIKPLVDAAVRAVEVWLSDGPEKSQKIMSMVNTKSFVTQPVTSAVQEKTPA
eukprot:TRINITY_DN12139_c0_g1_i1.p1 TRINITY_DN12139_c0_g1~~TRINITY_DN12139_c0_g1_i1.p1  ORF type:complete len:290 (+),score=75.11 TRINITY_DN12139_c0_g1_i1:44-871(+)